MMNVFGIEITLLLALTTIAIGCYVCLKCKRRKEVVSCKKRREKVGLGRDFQTLDILLFVVAFIFFASAVYLICSVL